MLTDIFETKIGIRPSTALTDITSVSKLFDKYSFTSTYKPYLIYNSEKELLLHPTLGNANKLM